MVKTCYNKLKTCLVLEIRNLDSFVAFLLPEIVDFLNLANFLLLNLENFLFDLNPELSTLALLSVVFLQSSSLLAVIYSWLA